MNAVQIASVVVDVRPVRKPPASISGLIAPTAWALASGSYRAELQRRGIDSSKNLPQTVSILSGQTTRLDISIDTGIR